MRRILSLLLLALSMSAIGQEFDYGAYKPAKLSALVADAGAHATDWFAEGHPRYQTRATFTGRLRPTPADTRQFIARWVKAMGHPDAYAEVFKQEIELTQDATSYWMPVQDVLVEQLRSEVPADTDVDVYLLLMGSQSDRLVFAVSEFDALADAHAPAEAAEK